MDFTNLKKINVRDVQTLIHPARIQELLTTKQDLLINVLLVLATVVFIFATLNGYFNESHKLKNNSVELDKKLKAITEHKKADAAIAKFTQSFPEEISGDRLMNIITELATKREIQIISVSPARTSEKNLYSMTNLEFVVTANSYADLGLFVHDIEDLPYAIRLERWTGKQMTQRNIRNRENEEDDHAILESQMTIGIVQLITK